MHRTPHNARRRPALARVGAAAIRAAILLPCLWGAANVLAIAQGTPRLDSLALVAHHPGKAHRQKPSSNHVQSHDKGSLSNSQLKSEAARKARLQARLETRLQTGRMDTLRPGTQVTYRMMEPVPTNGPGRAGRKTPPFVAGPRTKATYEGSSGGHLIFSGTAVRMDSLYALRFNVAPRKHPHSVAGAAAGTLALASAMTFLSAPGPANDTGRLLLGGVLGLCAAPVAAWCVALGPNWHSLDKGWHYSLMVASAPAAL